MCLCILKRFVDNALLPGHIPSVRHFLPQTSVEDEKLSRASEEFLFSQN